jgi:hypothetical protein
MKNILSHSASKARTHFLKEESYFNFDLPTYFSFQKIIDLVADKLNGKKLSDFYNTTIKKGKKKAIFPGDVEDVNYRLLNNKDGKFAWRPFQLIHPALYVSLVKEITEKENWKIIQTRFKAFDSNKKIKCYSLPIVSESKLSDKAETITNWYHSIEQRSIELALKYDYVLHADIADCYGSIYTHSVVWAIHTKSVGKVEKNNSKLLGNIIDRHLQGMSYGQTNGIPQGSVLMDFIAEIVLGSIDLELSKKIEKSGLTDYQIIRYRDDYRIFTNNPQDADLITKFVTEILIEYGMRLNTQKTLVSNSVVRDSIKKDKLFWLTTKKPTRTLQDQLLILHLLSNEHVNSGSLQKALISFYERIKDVKKCNENITVLISILVDITFKNPRVYPISMAILSKLLTFTSIQKQKSILKDVFSKFQKIPNTGHFELWLQRAILKLPITKKFKEPLCKIVDGKKVAIWDSSWLNTDFQNIIESTSIINSKTLAKLDSIIKSDEVLLFETKSTYKY